MARALLKHSEEKLKEIKTSIENFQTDWITIQEDLQTSKDELKSDDLFSTIEYLASCDQQSKIIYKKLQEIDSDLKQLKKIKESDPQNTKILEQIELLHTQISELRTSMQNKLLHMKDEYSILSENTLRSAQDRISKASELMLREKILTNLKTDINQGLDRELFLQELRDSLETYREAREDFISELIMDSFQQLPERLIPEDLGEERPEIDSVISQLDTAISECDNALLIREIME